MRSKKGGKGEIEYLFYTVVYLVRQIDDPQRDHACKYHCRNPEFPSHQNILDYQSYRCKSRNKNYELLIGILIHFVPL